MGWNNFYGKRKGRGLTWQCIWYAVAEETGYKNPTKQLFCRSGGSSSRLAVYIILRIASHKVFVSKVLRSKTGVESEL